MSSHDYQEQSLEELDAADRDELERAQETILHIVADRQPSTTSELSALVRDELGEVDNAVIRAAVLMLLNDKRIEIESGRAVAAH